MAQQIKRWIRLLLLCFCPAVALKIKLRIDRFNQLTHEEMKLPVRVPLSKRIWGWKRGFLSHQVLLLPLNRGNVRQYLPDIDYYRGHPYNGMFSSLIENKLSFYFTLSVFCEHLPTYYLLLYRGEIVWLDGRYRAVSSEQVDAILDLCREKGKLAMKPLAKSCGEGFYAVSFDREGYRLNGKPIGEDLFRSLCRTLTDYVVTEYVKQHSYADALFPRAANTIRILTVRDYDSHECFIPRAVHRIGKGSTIPVDNWSQGGLVSALNVDSGELGPAAGLPEATLVVWYDRHPDTDAPITGTVVPNWSTVKSTVLKMAEHLSMVPYIGWDVVITDEGFKILEVNTLTGTDMFQMERPLLDDERLRGFYARRIPTLRTKAERRTMGKGRLP